MRRVGQVRRGGCQTDGVSCAGGVESGVAVAKSREGVWRSFFFRFTTRIFASARARAGRTVGGLIYVVVCVCVCIEAVGQGQGPPVVGRLDAVPGGRLAGRVKDPDGVGGGGRGEVQR